jgi:hypothetical protein
LLSRLPILAAAVALVCSAQIAEELFASKILPVLERDCQGCHGPTQALSKLDLSTRESLVRGGTRGAALVPGNSEESLLIHVLEGRHKLQMPPGEESKKLTPDAIAAFRTWVDAGAPWPQKAAQGKWDYKAEDLWAFQPLRRFEEERRVDDFIHARLIERGISPAPKADRRVLIRRATLDLTGLPPAPEEVDAFVSDNSPRAWEKLIDRLLASPRYGERWGRHWLDVVRYADTSGYSNDFERANAWRYRDYVVRSFNSDKAYDQFIREQIAGDELYPENPEAILATGFLRAGPWEHTGMSVEAVTRQSFLDDVTHATAATFLGVTLGCARCHDHKFDPIPTRDYYRMQAVFAATEFARPKVPFLPEEKAQDMKDGAEQMRTRHQLAVQKAREYREQAAQLLLKKYNVSRTEELPKGELDRAMRTGAGLDPERYEEYKLFEKHSQLYRESLDRFEPKAFAVSSGPLDGFTDGGSNLRYPRRADYKPPATHILPGGNIQSPGEPVTPGVLSALETFGRYPALEIPVAMQGRRSALATWIADAKNPLTARVMVNRIWQGHFGRGIAGDANNFGKMGKKPTHPELLDWLAGYFLRHGWSVKAMHRVIMTSEAYQRASDFSGIPAAREKDPENALLAYFLPRRMEAEELRDSILSVSGELSLDSGGPGVYPQINEDVARQPQHRMGSLAPAYHPSPSRRQRNWRSIYTFQQRSLIDPMIEVFNGPNPDVSCERRDASIVPTQAFVLFNSQMVNDMALAMAVRLEREAATTAERIRRAFRLAYGRQPDDRELDLSRAHLKKMTAYHQANPAPAKPEKKPVVHLITSELTGEIFRFVQQEDPATFEANLHPSEVGPETRALSDLALVLLNSNEFVYVY